MKVTNWGKYPVLEADFRSFFLESEARTVTHDWPRWIPRGLGRCYGDSALAPAILSTLGYNRFLDFDPETGVVTCQAGVSFEQIIETLLPRGWFLPVTPGTKFITVGGAIASDIHGKNHHSESSFSRHLDSLRLMLASGEVLHCSRTENADAFWATCGGMGLTGLILDATFRMKPVETAWIKEDSRPAKDLDTIFRQFEESHHYTYSVAWLDTVASGKKLGRSILLNGEHARLADLNAQQKRNPLVIPPKKKINVPLNLPGFTLNKLSIQAFNTLFYGKHPSRDVSKVTDYDKYYYPLDGIHNWNRIYGKRGFTQYQFVLPPATGYEGVKQVLEHMHRKGFYSFLTVLKVMGEQEGMLSFPMPGYTLTLDLPISAALFPFLNELDEMVGSRGGRLYLTKDVRMERPFFEKSYPRYAEWLAIKQKLDPEGRMGSLQSARIGLG